PAARHGPTGGRIRPRGSGTVRRPGGIRACRPPCQIAARSHNPTLEKQARCLPRFTRSTGMKQVRLALAAVVVFGANAVRADEKKDAETKDKLVGNWEVIKEGTLPIGSTVEFTKDGKLKMTIKGEKTINIEGTFKVEGEAFKSTLKMGDKEH